jgi:hypothetical protein
MQRPQRLVSRFVTAVQELRISCSAHHQGSDSFLRRLLWIGKAVAIGSVSRFIVVDDSSKSGHLAELPEALRNNWITVILRMCGSEPSFLSRGVSVTSSVVLEREYTADTLRITLEEGVRWAEAKVGDLSTAFAQLYPWRTEPRADGPPM